ncbi:sigma 54-interacting transcriptional regulator [Leisingera sp. SS27]|uniref:sigma-54-dependent Fis family transcriptional regulator n=1 Tax=Leisingera sp. SS27 TaxID=2979462 RepID=UPI00232B61A7|nr:sigma 54-interacting transcriptional regulator [Leisingera sp. SS27]MDC0660564.1 sigma 54-interacting transcriptional regulator [Leisingera sp. SS27]
MLDEAVADAVDLSKLRCEIDHRLKHYSNAKMKRLSNYEVQVRRKAVEHYLGGCRPVIETLRTLSNAAGYCMLIADSDGVIVKEFSDSVDAQQLSNKGLKCGAMFDETRAGTNAIGLSKDLGRTVTVSGRDHYFKLFESFSCTAAPVLDELGKVVAVINLSGHHDRNTSNAEFVRYVVSHAAAQIQTSVFRRAHDESLLIQIREGSEAPPNSLLAVSEDGTIAGATHVAAKIVSGLTPADLSGRDVNEFLNTDIEALIPSVGRTQYIELNNQRTCFATPQHIPTSWQIARSGRNNLPTKVTSKSGIMPSVKIAQGSDLRRLVGNDARMRNNLELSERMLLNGVPLMLNGEAGTGKVSFARALHERTQNTVGAPILINCAVISVEDLESELKKFLAPPDDSESDPSLAGGTSTLILREVGELPLEQQATLFATLASDMSADLGLESAIDARKRIICTSSLGVQKLRDRGSFKPELLHLINGAAIQIPPLRERTDLEAILNEHLARFGGGELTISSDTRDLLLNYNWPGNLSEMVSAIRYAAVSCVSGIVTLDHLPSEIVFVPNTFTTGICSETLPPRRVASTQTLNESRADAERQRITQALVSAGWNVSQAAEVIGVSRATMHRKMKSHEIERPAA